MKPSLNNAYIPEEKSTSFDFDLSISLGLEPRYRKIDNFKQIQERISTLYREQRVTPVFWIDEVQYLHHSILADLKLLMNFEMDSRNYAMMILSGLPAITSTLSMRVHEALYQRIVINYTFSGLTQTEVTSYIQSRLEICGVARPIMVEAVYEVIYKVIINYVQLVLNKNVQMV